MLDMRFWPKIVTEAKVRRELDRRGGTYSVRLRGLDEAWNPEPMSLIERGMSLAKGAPFSGPFTVMYSRDAAGNVSAHLRRH